VLTVWVEVLGGNGGDEAGSGCAGDRRRSDRGLVAPNGPDGERGAGHNDGEAGGGAEAPECSGGHGPSWGVGCGLGSVAEEGAEAKDFGLLCSLSDRDWSKVFISSNHSNHKVYGSFAQSVMADFDPAVELFPVITNRHGLRVFVKLLMVPGSEKNVYLAHGFSDVHDTPHMRALTAAFVGAGYNVVVWDATHSWGRSEGASERASFYYHHEDLEDVIDWSRGQPWWRERFVLAGHSLGGMVAGTYAAAHASAVERLVLVAPVVSGPALRRRIPLPVRAWWRVRGQVSAERWGIGRYGWELMRSTWSYDLLKVAHRLVMPVLIVGAGRDLLIPPRMLRRLFGRVASDAKRLVVVPGARHGFDREWEMERLEGVVGKWLNSETTYVYSL
jgi:pimeloyl-ACP methyl ester carboxylesterase